MRKYVYKNATVYITEPTEEQLDNIRKATERFVKQLIREGMIGNESYGYRGRVSVSDSYARKRNREIKKEDRANQAVHRSL